MLLSETDKRNTGDYSWYPNYKYQINNKVHLDKYANDYIEYFDEIVDRVGTTLPIANYGCGVGNDSKLLAYLLPHNQQVLYDKDVDVLNGAIANMKHLSRRNPHQFHFRNENVLGFTKALTLEMVHSMGLYNYYDAEVIRKNLQKIQKISNNMVHAVHGLMPKVWVPTFCKRRSPEQWVSITAGMGINVETVNDQYYLLTWSKDD